MSIAKSGIYEIKCVVSGKSYVGSSQSIYSRFSQHRNLLRKSTHPSPRLQQAWNKHGEHNFVFSILEECPIEKLFEREQVYIDLKKRDYNSMPKVRVITPEMRRKMNAAMKAIAEATTHCPKGHEYSPENTYFGKVRGERRCKKCNAERVALIYANETPEEKASRNARNNANYYAKHEERRAKQNEYSAAHREEKRAYDKAYRPIKNARRRKTA